MKATSKISASTLTLCIGLLGACSKDQPSGNESTSEIVTAVVAGTMNSRPDGSHAKLFRGFSLIPEAIAGFACPTPISGSSGNDCAVDSSGKAMTLEYNSCNFGNNSAVWKGAVVLTSSAPVSCGSFPSEAPGATLLRTFSPGTTRSIGNSVHVTKIDTTEPSGYASAVSGGTRITFETSTDRKIEILGVHVTATKQFRGNGNEGRTQIAWDHTTSTAADAPLEAKAVSGGVVLNGTVVTQNNLELSTGTSVFENVTFAPGCCYPIGGKVTTEFSGSKTGSETLNFSNTSCGSASFKNLSGDSANLTLVHCL